MAVLSSFALHLNGSVHHHKPSNPYSYHHLKTFLSSTIKPFFKELQHLPMKVDISGTIKNTSFRILDALFDNMFQFVDQPLLPSQINFAPVLEEIKEAIEVTCTEGEIPVDFPEGVYIRNGSNPLFGGLKSVISIFGRSNHTWVEGEGMLHALYFRKKADGEWTVSYSNRYVESKTFKLETKLNKPSFVPALEGDSSAVLAAYAVNMLRFGMVNKHMSNTNVFEHSGKIYSVAENYVPQEIDISTLETLEDWDINGAWTRPFSSHPKKAPESKELVIMGFDAQKPYYEMGVVSVDGKKLLHKADLKFNNSVFSHEIGVTLKYNVIIDMPLTFDIGRLFKGRPLAYYDKNGPARIGVMPRYGDADSIKWFNVETYCMFHILNCFEDNEEVVVRGCRSVESVLPGPERGENKFEWFSRGFRFEDKENCSAEKHGYLFHSVYEWRLNMVTGEVNERSLTGRDFSMDFPFINGEFTGLKHKYGYTQVADSMASSSSGMAKYGGLAKLFLDEQQQSSQGIKIEYHKFEENVFCTGAAFVRKEGEEGVVDEDDGGIVTFVHNEVTNVSQAYIIDTKRFESEPIAKISLPQRVPYGFHGVFVSMPAQA